MSTQFSMPFLVQAILTYTAQQQIAQSQLHGGETMSTDTKHCPGSGRQLMIPMLALLTLLGVGCSEKEATAPQEAAPAEATAPQVAEPVAPPSAEETESASAQDEQQAVSESPAADKPADSSMAAADGQKIYQTYCQACHAAGVAGAPKLGDKQAWVPRIAKGEDAPLTSVKNGLNNMPPKGACMTCSDAELRAAVAYMIEQSS
jgi:cytochrome c5